MQSIFTEGTRHTVDNTQVQCFIFSYTQVNGNLRRHPARMQNSVVKSAQ